MDRAQLRRRAARARARRAGAPARPPPLLLEEREVGARDRASTPTTSRGSGSATATTTTAIRGGSSATRATDLAAGRRSSSRRRDAAPACAGSPLECPGWPGHLAGQHVDVRLTAEDGYQAQRSYSMASPAEGELLELTVERLDDGEVSPYLTDELRLGDRDRAARADRRLLRLGAGAGGPLLLIAGGRGVVPLMAMLRARVAAESDVPVRMLLSSRSQADVIYRRELEARPASRASRCAHAHPVAACRLERLLARRIDRAMLAEVAWPPAERPHRVRVRADRIRRDGRRCARRAGARPAADHAPSASARQEVHHD